MKNYQEWDIVQALCCSMEERSQREIARETGCSLGIVNRTLQHFREEGLVNDRYCPTEQALAEATNGVLFFDALKEVSGIRERILSSSSMSLCL